MTRAERVEKAARAMLVEFDWLVNIGRIHGYEQTRDALRAALALPVDAPVDAGGAFRDIWQHDETGRIVELPLGSPSPGARYALVATTNAQIGHPTPPAPHVDAGGAVAWRDSFPPTHYCKECRALWRKWPDGSWSLVTMSCGKCCDNAPMGEQIVSLYTHPAPVAAGGAVALYDAATDALDAVDNIGKCPFCGAHQPDSWESGEHYGECHGVALYEALTRHPTPPPDAVELAREKCILACRRAAEEYAERGHILTDRIPTIMANAVSCGRALLAAEAGGGS